MDRTQDGYHFNIMALHLSQQDYENLAEIYERYNLAEESPDLVDVVDDINYLLSKLGMDQVGYQVHIEDKSND